MYGGGSILDIQVPCHGKFYDHLGDHSFFKDTLAME